MNNVRPESKGQGHRLIMQLKSRLNDLNEVLEQRDKDIDYLIKHSAVQSSDLEDSAENVDWSTESFINLPEHLQDAINKESKIIYKRGV